MNRHKTIRLALDELKKEVDNLEPTRLHKLMHKTTRRVLALTAQKIASQARKVVDVDEKRFARALRRGSYVELTGGFVSTKAGNGRYSKKGQYLTRHGDQAGGKRYKPIPMWMIGGSKGERMTEQGMGRAPHTTGKLEAREYLDNAPQLESEALGLLDKEFKRQVEKVIRKANR